MPAEPTFEPKTLSALKQNILSFIYIILEAIKNNSHNYICLVFIPKC